MDFNAFSQKHIDPLSLSLFGDAPSPDPRTCYQSESLSRYGSSDGSSCTSSTPTSPTMSNAFYTHQSPPPRSSPYSQYLEVTTPSSSSYYGSPELGAGQEFTDPRSVSEDSNTHSSSSQGGRDYPVCCLHAGCDAKPFKRRADLDRHYKHKHAPESQKESYYCDYNRCQRRRDPFHRRDHFRDHLREFHKEDIEKRGTNVKEDWLESRNAAQSWWRCTKCLTRIYINRAGYDCPTCKTTCQPKRKEIRRRE